MNVAMTAMDIAAAVSIRHGPLADRAGTIDRRTVVIGMLLFAIVWLSQLALTSLSPPVDDLEQLTWVRSLEWGYYKHPPLPTWLLWLPVRIFGWSAGTVYAMGAATTLAALGIYWRLLARLRGEGHAFVALLATACITYYNGRLNYYNHNVVLLLASTACAALAWQAFATRRLRWWAALGLALGLGALAKYEVAVTLCSVLAFASHQRAWRDPVHRRGAVLAGLIALAIFAPHVEWLRSHDFGPVRYALSSSLAANFAAKVRAAESMHWLIDQLLNRALPALLLLLWVARLARRPGSAAASPLQPSGRDECTRARALLLAWGGVPLLFMPLIGLATGADLQLHWGTPFLLFAVPAAMELAPRVPWSRAEPKAVMGAFIVIQALLLTLSVLTSPRGPRALRANHWRNVDSQGIADALAVPARAALGGPVRVIVGPASLAGAIALRLPERPLVLIDGRADRSPWVGPGLLAACGAVELGETSRLRGGVAVGPALAGWSWRVLPPTASATACPTAGVP